jgi:hypothetical protein
LRRLTAPAPAPAPLVLSFELFILFFQLNRIACGLPASNNQQNNQAAFSAPSFKPCSALNHLRPPVIYHQA